MHVSRKAIALALLALLAGLTASQEVDDYDSGYTDVYDYGDEDVDQVLNDLLGNLGLSEGQMTECKKYFSSPAAEAADTACGDVLYYGVECLPACSKWVSGIPDFCAGFFATFVQSTSQVEVQSVVDALNDACSTTLKVTLPTVVPGKSPTPSPEEEPPSPPKAAVTDVEVEAGDSTVVFKVVSDPTAVSKDLPILFLLPDWNVPVEQYSGMAEGLASKGYVVVGASVPTTLPSSIEGCPDEQLVPSAAALTLFAKNAELFAEALGPKAGAKPEVVVLGQGSGGWAALLAASGGCKDATDPQAAALCEGFDGFGGSIKGAIVSDISLSEAETAAFKLTNAFSLFMVGNFDTKNATRLAFEGTTSDCSGFVQLSDASAYSWVDSPYGQWANCTSADAGIAPLIPPNEEQQAATVDLVVTVVDSATRASVLGDSEAAAVLGRLGDNEQVVKTEGLACFAALE